MKSALHLPKDFCCAHVYFVPLLAGGATSTHAASVAWRTSLTSIVHAARQGATCSQLGRVPAHDVWSPTYTSCVLGRGGAAAAGGVTETDHEVGAALSKVSLLRAREVAWQRNVDAGCMHTTHAVHMKADRVSSCMQVQHKHTLACSTSQGPRTCVDCGSGTAATTSVAEAFHEVSTALAECLLLRTCVLAQWRVVRAGSCN